MPTIFTPKPAHACLTDLRFEVDLNKATERRVAGEIWECPTCGRRYLWFVDSKATVSYPKWIGISRRASDRIIRRAEKHERESASKDGAE